MNSRLLIGLRRWPAKLLTEAPGIRALCILFGLLLHLAALSQVKIVEGNGVPPAKLQAEWYLDTVSHRPYYFHDGRWQPWTFAGAPVLKIEICANTILLKTDQGYDYFSDLHGRRVSGHIFTKRCLPDCIYWKTPDYHGFSRDAAMFAINVIDRPEGQPPLPAVVPDTVGEELCFCMSEAVRGTATMSDYHAWGMISTEGKWVIQPVFDSPFKFVNGVAEVIYYGQKRKIDEHGNYVD